ncbi:hypothetical protein N9891_01970 [bacterium]|nr:hypothetical protein [bacterium]
MTDSPDWQTLIQKHLDGQSTEEEASVLSKEIETNAKVRSQYLKAARIHGALCDELLALELDSIPPLSPDLSQNTQLRAASWPKPLAAAVIIAGAFVGLLGVVWAISSPTSEEKMISVLNGDFEDSVGPIPPGFPTDFGNWSGDPAEVIEEDGNRVLRFLETANVTGKPNGGASACNVFQLIDLTSLRQEWNTDDQITLELSARFHRESAPTDAEFPLIKGSCAIHLYQSEPGEIGKAWPLVISDALALGNKSIKLESGEESATISATCILAPEATIALISLNVNTRTGSKTPIKLGGYYADDVRLTLTKRPNLPIRIVE